MAPAMAQAMAMDKLDKKMKQINHDYARTKWPNHRPGNNFGAWLIISIIFFIGFIAMTAAAIKPDSQNSITSVTSDDLMSSERAEYMMIFENGKVFDEGDMQ